MDANNCYHCDQLIHIVKKNTKKILIVICKFSNCNTFFDTLPSMRSVFSFTSVSKHLYCMKRIVLINFKTPKLSMKIFSIVTCIYFHHLIWFMVLNASFNNISVLLVEETGVPGENHRPVTSD